MSKKRANSDFSRGKVEKLETTSPKSTLQLLPLSHVGFRASWSLSQDAIDAGLLATAQDKARSHLVLRTYSLSSDSSASAFSDHWRDFSIGGKKSRGEFILAKPTPKIRAVIGLISNSGRFSPLVRSEAVALLPTPDVLAAESGEVSKAPNLNKSDTYSTTAADAKPSAHTGPSPLIGQNSYHSPPSHALAKNLNPENEDKSSAAAFSHLEEFWSESAPIQVRAEFVVSGKIAPNTKLLLGNQIFQPDSDGFVEWKQRLDSFEQVWPLLEEALASPSVEAGPSIEFFKDTKPAEKLLELHATLKIAGKINDPEYRILLPENLHVGDDGTFKISRMLPDGALIFPGLSLIAVK